MGQSGKKRWGEIILGKDFLWVKPYTVHMANRTGGTWEKEMDWYKTEGQTNTETGIIKISENEILAGYELLKKTGQGKGIETEPSGSAGLALYMRRWEKGKIKKDAKVIIVNTGKGIISDTKK